MHSVLVQSVAKAFFIAEYLNLIWSPDCEYSHAITCSMHCSGAEQFIAIMNVFH